MLRHSADKAAASVWRVLILGLAFSASASKPFINDWVSQQAYPFEEYDAPTDDGCLLGMMRIPQPGAPVVLLQHGVLDSAWAWVYNSEFKALAFQLHDAGFDVWLGNNRGNRFSTRWIGGADATQDLDFWNFTFDEMAALDLPAMIGAVLNVTGLQKLAYVGHSQGSMQMLIAGSLPERRHWIASRVSIFVALSPVAWLGHVKTPFLPWLSRTSLIKALWLLFPRGFLADSSWRKAAHAMCVASLGQACKFSLGMVCGTSHLDHARNIEGYADIFPFGTSFKNMLHFAQGVKSGSLRRYNYSLKSGNFGNWAAYGQAEPPEYKLSGLAVPTALMVAEMDRLSDATDVDHLKEILAPTGNLLLSKNYPSFSHATWLLGSEQAGYYVSDVIDILKGRVPDGAEIFTRLDNGDHASLPVLGEYRDDGSPVLVTGPSRTAPAATARKIVAGAFMVGLVALSAAVSLLRVRLSVCHGRAEYSRSCTEMP